MNPFQRLLVRLSGWALGLFMLGWFVMVIGGLITGWKPKASWIPMLMFSMVLMALITVWGKWMRERFVREGAMPQFLKMKLREEYPGMSGKDAELVERGLRQFFLACVRSGKKPVGMPSVVVAHLWRTFANHPAAYESWCQMAFGKMLPVSVVSSLSHDADRNDALRRTWYWACKEEAIQPDQPSRLPILFALDTKLAIAGGIVYLSSAQSFSQQAHANHATEVYFGASFSSDQYCGSNSDFGGADGGGGDGGDGGGGGD